METKTWVPRVEVVVVAAVVVVVLSALSSYSSIKSWFSYLIIIEQPVDSVL